MIIGINELSHDQSTSLVSKKTIHAVEEERFSRNKHSMGALYSGKNISHSLKYLKNISPNSTLISSWNKTPSYKYTIRHHKNPIERFYFQTIASNLKLSKLKALKQYYSTLCNSLTYQYKRPKIKHINHHLAHAASAYRCSPHKKSNTLVIDGAGESNSTSIYLANKDIHLLKSFSAKDSLGFLYSFASGILNMGLFGEGKTMGLSAYGSYNKKFDNLIINNKLNIPKIKNLFKFKRKGQITQDHKDIAFMVQKQLEDCVINLINKTYEITGLKNWDIAGGVGLNCLMNSKILNLDNVKNIFVQPAANDAGSSLGAALEYQYKTTNISKINLKNAYLGPSYSENHITSLLKKYKIKYEYHNDIVGHTAELIANGSIVAWFQGGMEFGPRALGNRSIIGNPTLNIKDKVNDIKFRERWRPLAPSILEQDIKKYYNNSYKSPFMNLSFTTKDEKIEKIPSVVHVDKSARVQTVNKDNGLYFDLIKKFKKQTNCPILLNTSFNDNIEPIVMTPENALNSFKRMNLDYLVLGNHIIKKSQV